MNTKITTKRDVAIIGGGPAGLTTAIMLARRGYDKIRVYERFSEPPPPDSPVWSSIESDRTYNIGISGRGQNVLKYVDAMNTIDQYSTSVMGRCYWEPDTPIDKPMELVWTNRSYTTKCIPRDCLTSCLIHEINTKYNSSIQIYFDSLCSSVTVQKFGDSETCNLDFYDIKNAETKKWSTQASWVIGTDGSQSAVRESMIKSMKNKFFYKKFDDKNIRVYRTIPLYFDQDSEILLKPSTTSMPPMVGLGLSSTTSPALSTSPITNENDNNNNIIDLHTTSTSTSTSTTTPFGITTNTNTNTKDTMKPTKWKGNLNYSVRTKVDINIDALPLKNGPYLGVILYRPWGEFLT